VTDTIREYLTAIAGFAPGGIDAFLLRHGREWETGPGTFRGSAETLGKCYQMAANAALRDRSLMYVEGKVTVFGVPIDHAWVVDDAGVVIDPTIPDDSRAAGAEFFGVPIATDYLVEVLIRSRTYGVIDSDGGRITRGADDGRWEVARWA
jgi:hypothetical protein